MENRYRYRYGRNMNTYDRCAGRRLASYLCTDDRHNLGVPCGTRTLSSSLAASCPGSRSAYASPSPRATSIMTTTLMYTWICKMGKPSPCWTKMMMIRFDRYYKSLIRTKATSPISLPARQATYSLDQV